MIDPKELRRGNIVNVLSVESGTEYAYADGETITVSQHGKTESKFIQLTVHEIMDTHIMGRTDGNDRYMGNVFSNLKPIPLTEEWLLKFGFEKVKFSESWPTYQGKEIGWDNGAGGYIVREDENQMAFYYSHLNLELDLCERVSNEIHYVHQLQNLYFALTGNELTLTPAKEAVNK